MEAKGRQFCWFAVGELRYLKTSCQVGWSVDTSLIYLMAWLHTYGLTAGMGEGDMEDVQRINTIQINTVGVGPPHKMWEGVGGSHCDQCTDIFAPSIYWAGTPSKPL